MLFFVLMVILCIFSARADEEAVLTPDEKSECAKQLIEWCNGMQYSDGGYSMMSISYHEGGDYYRVFCASDSEGTNCTRNGSPWFTCSPEHILTYKGEVMSEPTSSVDDDVCESANKVSKDLFLTNRPRDNATLTKMHKELEQFFKTLEDMQERMSMLRKMMSMIPGMEDDLFSGFDAFDSERSPEIVTLPPTNEQPSKEDINGIEKE